MKRNYSSFPISRRTFVGMTGKGAAALTVLPSYLSAQTGDNSNKVRIGIVGGNFGADFPFHKHPDCIVEAVSDLIPERRNHLMEVYKCSKSYESLSLLLRDPKVDAVFLATPVPDHASHTIQSLNAGKHVLCAVPVANKLEEVQPILDTVKSSGLIYMMAETSVYHPTVIQARQWHKEGKFGKIFSAEGEYYHPNISNIWYDDDHNKLWRQGQPPMHYCTHATSYLISVTGERCTSVSCIGWGDNDFLLKHNNYNQDLCFAEGDLAA